MAIDEFNQIKIEKSEIKLDGWTKKYKPLYERISYGPKDLPALADANIEGIHFTFISQFHSIFEKKYHYFADESNQTINFLQI